MKIYRLTIIGNAQSHRLVSYDSSERRMSRDFDQAQKLRSVRSVELDVINSPGPIKRNTLLEALNSKTDHWQFQPLLAFSRDE